MGYKVKYIGANTPSSEIESAVKIMAPDYLALSITNYYNLIYTKKLLERLRQSYPQLKIILGGQASMKYAHDAGIPYDTLLSSYEDIVAFRGEES
jgi:methanogenic corrinoid protein MtbC1